MSTVLTPAGAPGPRIDAVPLMALDRVDPAVREEQLAAIAALARDGAFTLGAEVEAFEREFAAYCDTAHAVGVSSGTDALTLALRALGIGPGDEVILPANTFIATAEAVSAVGAVPRLVDVDPDTHLITAAHVADAVGPGVRCVIPVHLYGSVVDMDPLLEVARAAGLAVVEDACQAHGAHYHGRRVGTLGDAGCFSFYPTKNLGCWGDGGAVVTADAELAERVRMLRSHGERRRYHHEVVGATARLDAVQAAVLRIRLRTLDDDNDRRRRHGQAMTAALQDVPLDIPRPASPGADHVHHLYIVATDARDELRAHLQAEGIASAVHYPTPVHRTAAYAHLGLGAGALPVCETLADTICTVPLFPQMRADERDRVVHALTTWATAKARLSMRR